MADVPMPSAMSEGAMALWLVAARYDRFGDKERLVLFLRDMKQARAVLALCARERADESRMWINVLREYADLLGIDTTREGGEPGPVQILHAIQDLKARADSVESKVREAVLLTQSRLSPSAMPPHKGLLTTDAIVSRVMGRSREVAP